MQEKYNAQDIEKKWQTQWLADKAFKTDLDKNKESIMYLKCSLIHPVTSTWVTFVTTLLAT